MSAWAAIRLNGTPANDDSGQTLIEYGLMIALLALIAVSAVALVGDNIPNLNPAANALHS
jgi:Flp pilus assembly pilin Flp